MSREGQPIDPFNLPEGDAIIETFPEEQQSEARRLVGLDPSYIRYINFAERGKCIPEGERGSADWVRNLGQYWTQARKQQGLSRIAVAEAMGQPNEMVEYIELGLLTNQEFKTPALFEGFASALGDPALYDRFQDRYQLPRPDAGHPH